MTQTATRPDFPVRSAALLTAVYGASAVPLWSIGSPPVAIETWVASVVLAAALVALSAIDLETFRLPDVVTLPLAGFGILAVWWFGWDDPVSRIAAAGLAFAAFAGLGWAYERVRGRPGLGLGDAKLLAASGAWLGIGGLPAVVLWACALALAWAGVGWLRGTHYSLGSALAFGPFLAFATWLVWLYGPLF